jgi:hypothetical protein
MLEFAVHMCLIRESGCKRARAPTVRLLAQREKLLKPRETRIVFGPWTDVMPEPGDEASRVHVELFLDRADAALLPNPGIDDVKASLVDIGRLKLFEQRRLKNAESSLDGAGIRQSPDEVSGSLTPDVPEIDETVDHLIGRNREKRRRTAREKRHPANHALRRSIDQDRASSWSLEGQAASYVMAGRAIKAKIA